MRDFRDAKTMAQSLRKALAANAVTVTHSQSLELIAQALGLENWNTLSAKIDTARAAEPRPSPAPTGSKTVYCGFCGKPQQDVTLLIAGPPPAAICDGCVDLCDNIVFDNRLGKEIAEARQREPGHDPDAVALDALRRFSDEQLRTRQRANADWDEHIVWGLRQIEARLEGRASEPWRPDPLAERRGWTRDPLEGKTRDEVIAQRAHLEGLLGPMRERTRLIERALAERGPS